MGMKIIRQADEQGCGLAALRTLLVHLSHDRHYAYLTMEGHPPYSLSSLQKAATKEGLTVEFRRAVAVSSIRQGERFPLLAIMKKDGREHMVIVERAVRGGLLLADPAKGHRRVRYEDFEKDWTQIYGEIISYERKKCTYRKTKIVPAGAMVLGISVELLANVSLLVGFYFMNGEGSFLLPVGAFLAFALFTILRRVLSTDTLKKFDGRWMGLTFDEDPKRFKTNYERYHSFKRNLLVCPFDFCSSLCLLGALAFLIGFNNPAFYIAFFAVGLYEALAVSFFEKRLRKRRDALEQDENALFAGNLTSQEALLKLSSLSETTYGIADRIGYSRIVFYALCLALTFLCFIGEGEVSLNFYLFHFFGVIAAGEAYSRIISFVVYEPIRNADGEYFREYLAKSSVKE